MGVRRRGRLGLERGPDHGGDRGGRAGPGHAGPGRPLGERLVAGGRWTGWSPNRSSTTRWPGSCGWPGGSARWPRRTAGRAGTGGPAGMAAWRRTERRPGPTRPVLAAVRPTQPPGRPPRTADRPGTARADGPALVRRAAAASFVLLRNEGQVLPFDPAAIGSIALIGPNAVHPVIQGGGSAIVAPVSGIHPRGGAAARALAGQAAVTVAPGCRTWTTVPEPAAGSLRDPRDRRAGAAAGIPRRRRDLIAPRAPAPPPSSRGGTRACRPAWAGARAGTIDAAHPVPRRAQRAAPDRRGRRWPAHADRGRRGGRRHGHPAFRPTRCRP